MRVLVIGASGFTGRRVLAACPDDAQLMGLARSRQAANVIEACGAEAYMGDLDDGRSVRDALRISAPDVVISVASLGFGHTDDLLAALEDEGVERAVFTSTTGIFTALEPASKVVRIDAEEAIRSSSISSTILRPTMIYGRGGDRNMERLLRWLHRIPVVAAPEGGRALQQPVHVDDLAAALVAAANTYTSSGKTINVPGPEALPFSEIVHLAGDAVGRRARVLPLPCRSLRSAVAIQARLLTSPRLTTEQIDRLTEDKSFDPAPAAELLKWSSRPFAEGIAEEARLLGVGP